MDAEVEEPEYTIKEFAWDILTKIPFLKTFFVENEEPAEEVKNTQNDDTDLPREELGKEQIIGKNKNHGLDNGLGTMKFIVKYELPKGVLKVIIQKADELVGKDPRGTSDPYGVISFVPPFKDNQYRTMVKMKTLSPVWNHVFVFLNVSEADLKKHNLRIVLYDWDKYGTHEPLGQVYYELCKLVPKVDVSSNIMWTEGDEGRSHITKTVLESSMFENSTLSKDDVVTRWLQDSRSVVSNIDIDDNRSVHSSIFSDEDRQIVMTSASMIAPNEELDFDQFEEDDDEMGFYNEDSKKEKEFYVDEKQMLEDNSVMMMDNEERRLLKTTYSSALDEVDGVDANAHDNASDITLGNNKTTVRRIEVMKYLSPLPNSRSKFGELFITLNYDIRTRKLVVTIVKAHNMIDPSRRSLLPYCTLRHLTITKDREKTQSHHHTSYRYYTSNPVWNEEFHLKVPPDKLKLTAVEIQVFHCNKASKMNDELLGIIRLGLKAYQKQRKHWTEFLGSIGVPVSKWHDIRL